MVERKRNDSGLYEYLIFGNEKIQSKKMRINPAYLAVLLMQVAVKTCPDGSTRT